MKVTIKNFDVQMEVKNKGIELDVSDASGHIGDLIVTKTKLVWCRGRTSPENGIRITWEKFIEFMEHKKRR